MSQTAIWSGHQFGVYPPNSSWFSASGIYIFAGVENQRWRPLYIGQASSFQQRFSNHEKWNTALKNGMTHVHALGVGKQSDRDAIEKQLISIHQPPLNDKLK